MSKQKLDTLWIGLPDNHYVARLHFLHVVGDNKVRFWTTYRGDIPIKFPCLERILQLHLWMSALLEFVAESP